VDYQPPLRITLIYEAMPISVPTASPAGTRMESSKLSQDKSHNGRRRRYPYNGELPPAGEVVEPADHVHANPTQRCEKPLAARTNKKDVVALLLRPSKP
jgi:hypothetical protein